MHSPSRVCVCLCQHSEAIPLCLLLTCQEIRMDLPWQPHLRLRTEPPQQFLFTPKIRWPHYHSPECPSPAAVPWILSDGQHHPKPFLSFPHSLSCPAGESLHSTEPPSSAISSTNLAWHTASHLPSTSTSLQVVSVPHTLTTASFEHPCIPLISLSFTDKLQSMCFFCWSCGSRKVRQCYCYS